MAAYRKKPVIVEAEYFSPDVDVNWLAAWCGGEVVDTWSATLTIKDDVQSSTKAKQIKLIEITTAQGKPIRVGVGEWIILEGDAYPGKAYPCKADVFDANYESEPV